MNEKQIEVGGKSYIIIERSMRDLLPILENTEQKQLGIELVKASVHDDKRRPLGDAVLDLGFGQFQALMAAVNDVHGIEPSEGNG